MLEPIRKPTAICTAQSSSRCTQPKSSKACSQLPLLADVTATSGTSSSMLLRLYVSSSLSETDISLSNADCL